MPTVPPLVLALPYVAWILLAALAFGGFLFVVVTRQLTDATKGYVRFMAVVSAILAGLVYLAEPGPVGVGAGSLAIRLTASASGWRPLLTLAFVALALVYAWREPNQRQALVVGVVGCLIGLAVLGYAALDWAPTQASTIPFLVQLAVLSLVTGGSMAAIVLGHWYLTTPKISERPLTLQCRLLLGGLIVQALLFVVWTTLGGGVGQDAFDAFTGGNLLLVALRLIVTLLFPLVLCWMAWKTALTRSMESATGLLYINLAAVMAGTIGAAALYLSTGLLV